MLYLFQTIYRPFLRSCYNIIKRIVFNFVVIIVVFIFISKDWCHSFEMLLFLSLFLFNGFYLYIFYLIFFLMFHLPPLAWSGPKSSMKIFLYEFLYKLVNIFKTWDHRKLGNIKKISNLVSSTSSAQCTIHQWMFVISGQKLRKNRYQSFLVLRRNPFFKHFL